jgi:hypothetical protein
MGHGPGWARIDQSPAGCCQLWGPLGGPGGVEATRGGSSYAATGTFAGGRDQCERRVCASRRRSGRSFVEIRVVFLRRQRVRERQRPVLLTTGCHYSVLATTNVSPCWAPHSPPSTQSTANTVTPLPFRHLARPLLSLLSSVLHQSRPKIFASPAPCSRHIIPHCSPHSIRNGSGQRLPPCLLRTSTNPPNLEATPNLAR